nr:reverse transcriptase domain-containing protein [Tanacetum cinerariifolium]
MDGESMEAFMKRFKAESMHVNRAPKCMRISGFMHDITNPDLIKRLNDNIPKSVDEMVSVTTSFLRGEVAAANQSRKKAPPTWRHHETSHKPNFDKRPDFKNRHNDGQENPIVIEAKVEDHLIHRIYVDEVSASEVLYEHCFNKLRPEVKSRMIPATAPLLGFSEEISWSLGQISLMISLRDGEHSISALMNFMVVRSPSPYNGIIGRPSLRKIQAEPADVTGVSRTIMKHRLNIRKGCPPDKAEKEGLDTGPEQGHPGGEVSIMKHRLNIRKGCPPDKAEKEGLDTGPEQGHPGGEVLKDKLIKEREVLDVVEEEGDSWMRPLLEYLTDEAQGKVRFLIVAIDYFTKWIEAKPVVTITGNQVKKFMRDNIVCRFGMPREIISDNEKQFKDNPFKDWCDKLNIKQRLSSVK